MQSARVMGEGRDIVLDDLHGKDFGYGVLFDPERYAQLNEKEKNQLVNRLEQLQKSYGTEGGPNYNLDVVRFLQLYQGDILSLIEEVTR